MSGNQPRKVHVSLEKVTIRGHHDPFWRTLPLLFRRASNYPETLSDNLVLEYVDKTYDAVILDNGLLRLTVLPQLGGHIYSAYDIVNGRELFFKPEPLRTGNVQKPGAWSAFGLEFNQPIGHGVYSRSPIDWHIEQSGGTVDEGAVWCGRLDPATGIRGDVRISLKAGEAKFHEFVKIMNLSLFAQRWYHWSNAAITAGPGWRFISPTYYMYHYGFRIREWPIIDGVDNSLYEKRQGSDSFSAGCLEDFFGCYHHATNEGVVFVADHRLLTGKKFFTWGGSRDAEFANAMFTDDGKVYTEIQAGPMETQAFFRRMEPFSGFSFDATWYGIKNTDAFLFADEDLCIGVSPGECYRTGVGAESLNLSATRDMSVTIIVRGKRKALLEKKLRLRAGAKARKLRLPRPLKEGDHLEVYDGDYPRRLEIPYRPTPDTDILERVSRNMNQAMHSKKNGKFNDPMDPVHRAWSVEAHAGAGRAMELYDKAVQKTANLAASGKMEEKIAPALAYLRRGEALLKLGRNRKALEDFARASELGLAEEAVYFRLISQPLDYTPKKSELDNLYRLVHPSNHAALVIMAIYYMRLKHWGTALRLLHKALRAGAQRELVLALEALALPAFAAMYPLPLDIRKQRILKELRETAPLLAPQLGLEENQSHNPVDRRACWQGAHIEWLLRAGIGQTSQGRPPSSGSTAMEWLVWAYRQEKCDGNEKASLKSLKKSAASPVNDDWPWAMWQKDILSWAMKKLPSAKFAYMLGCLYGGFNARREGIAWFRKAVKLDTKYWLAWRATGLYEMQVKGNFSKARTAYEKAYELHPDNRDVAFEYESVLSVFGDNEKRMQLLSSMSDEDQLGHFWPTRMVKLLYDLERYEECLDLQLTREMIGWEGEYDQRQTYLLTCVALARKAVEQKRFEKAYEYLDMSSRLQPTIKYNPRSHREHAVWLYWKGKVAKAEGNVKKAEKFYKQAWEAPEAHILSTSSAFYLKMLAGMKLGKEIDRKELQKRRDIVREHIGWSRVSRALSHEILALAECLAGDFDTAKTEINIADKLHRGNPRVREMRKYIAKKKLPYLDD